MVEMRHETQPAHMAPRDAGGAGGGDIPKDATLPKAGVDTGEIRREQSAQSDIMKALETKSPASDAKVGE